MSKILYYLLPLILSLPGAEAQVSIGTNAEPHPSAMLDMDNFIDGNHRGMLLPRIPLRSPTDRTAIPSPDEYLLVFSPYTTASHAGLNYWYNNRWNRFLNQTELYDSISVRHIAQVVFFANQSIPETTSHVTDVNKDNTPYKLPVDNVVFDSQNAYDKPKREYIIPEDGLYEIVCNVTLSDVPPNGAVSMQTFVRVNQVSVVNDLVNKAPSTVVGSVIYIAKLKKGDHVYGAAGIGNWRTPTHTFKVTASSLTITKY